LGNASVYGTGHWDSSQDSTANVSSGVFWKVALAGYLACSTCLSMVGVEWMNHVIYSRS
jgi:hypothetical protein